MRPLRKTLIFSILAASLAVGLGMVAVGGRMAADSVGDWSQPLGPRLALDEPAVEAEAAPREAQPPLATFVTGSAGVPTPFEPLPTPETPQTLCGGPPVMTLLGIGTDNREDSYAYGLADVIRVIRVDFLVPKITVLSLPRDVWVRIPAIEEASGITHGKLNQAFFYGGDGWGYYDGPAGGAGLTARTLKRNFGLVVDRYGVVNMITFEKLVDALGGIYITLAEPVDGTPIDAFTENMGYFPAGDHHFDGAQALRFARIRKRYNDFRRTDNQNQVLCALRKKLVSLDAVTAVPELVSAFQGSIQTDLSPQEIGQLACLLPQVKKVNITFASLPVELLEETWKYSPQLRGTTFTYAFDEATVGEIMAAFQAGSWPESSDESSCG